MLKEIGVIISFAFVIYAVYTFGYSFVSQYFLWTQDEWYTIAVIIMTGGWLLFREYSKRQVTQGAITQDGVKLIKNDEIIPFQKIEEITTEQNDSVFIHTAEGETEVRLSEREIVKFAEAGFARWSFEKKKVIMRRGSEQERLFATYSLTGKYAGSCFLFGTITVALFGAIVVIIFIGERGYLFIPGILYLLLILGINDYKEVEVAIEGHKIRLRDEKLVDHYMAFDEVDRVEKGLWRTKITAKDGRVVFFPQALFLLPELVELFAGLRRK